MVAMSEHVSALLDAPSETLQRPQAHTQVYSGTIDEPRPFEIEELFFSTTDKKGHIKTANSVFFRVAAYDRAHLLEKPHNIIRDPDMPRAVFHLMWEEIQADRPLFAYVKNRAADGRYYWVVALVTPSPKAISPSASSPHPISSPSSRSSTASSARSSSSPKTPVKANPPPLPNPGRLSPRGSSPSAIPTTAPS